MRREKGIYTKEKNLLFLKNVTEMGKNGNYVIKSKTAVKHKVSEIQFTHIFSGPQPVFEITRGKVPSFASKKGGKDEKGKDTKLNKKTGKNQGTLKNVIGDIRISHLFSSVRPEQLSWQVQNHARQT